MEKSNKKNTMEKKGNRREKNQERSKPLSLGGRAPKKPRKKWSRVDLDQRSHDQVIRGPQDPHRKGLGRSWGGGACPPQWELLKKFFIGEMSLQELKKKS